MQSTVVSPFNPSQVSTTHSNLTSSEANCAVVAEPGILLVGKKTSWASSLVRLIKQFGAEPILISPLSVTSGYVKSSGHGLILLDSTVRSERRQHLVTELVGSDVSLFYAHPVELGCWWLPALLYGEGCHGDPGFRASEFPYELKRIFQDMSRRMIPIKL